MMLKHSTWLAATALIAIIADRDAYGVVIASDNASDPAYAGGWIPTDDGGTGFGPWEGSGPYGPIYVMEIDEGTPELDNQLGAPAFRMATGGLQGGYIIQRPFDAPMQPGQTFKIDYDGYTISPTGVDEKGRDILIGFESEGGARVVLYGYYYNDFGFIFGSDSWGINAATANDNLAGGASLPPDPLDGIEWQTSYSTTDGSDGFSLTLDVVTIDTYRIRIVDDGVTKLDVSGQMLGDAAAGQGISRVNFYGSETSSGSPEPGGVFYFNNMIIETTSTGQPGDFDVDGDVDGQDFLIWQRGGSPNPLSSGDLTQWRNNFGPPLVPAGSAIPEPGAATLSALALLAAISVRGRRNSGASRL